MKELDTYRSLCTQFYDLSKPRPPQDVYEFYRKYVAAAKGPILEPMCGTGRFLLPLLAEGFAVEGFDASRHMLEKLHKKAQAMNLQPVVWQDYLENFHCEAPPDLIFIAAGSFGLITDLTMAQTCLTHIAQQLSEEGIFVFEVETLAAEPTTFNVWRQSEYPDETNKIVRGYFADRAFQDQVLTTECCYELWEGERKLQSETEFLKVRYYSPQIMMDMLHKAGFKSIKMVHAFDQDQVVQDTDAEIVFECRK